MSIIKPVLKYPGAKWRLAPWIISYLPTHTVYIEPYFGSGSVFFSKQPSKLEIINDISHDVYNLFRVVRDHGSDLADLLTLTPWSREEYELSDERTGEPIEDARRFVVRCWQAHGATLDHQSGWTNRGPLVRRGSLTDLWRKIPNRITPLIDRLKDAEIECRPALEVIERFNVSHACIYADPPYMPDTRSHRQLYQHEMNESDHLALLDALVKHRGFVVLSGYAHPLYDERLKHWRRVTFTAKAEKGTERIEVLWLNSKAAQSRQLPLFTESEVGA